jgi:hypothetical protein
MVTQNEHESTTMSGEIVLCQVDLDRAAAVARLLSAAGIECRLVPDADGCVVLVEERDSDLADLLLAKRKKDLEEEEESDDEEEDEEDDDHEEDEEDEDEDFDDEDEDEFEEEFDDDELDDDDDDIFYDDDDDE